MTFVLKDKISGMYIGSHRFDFAKLQLRDRAVEFDNRSQAESSLKELKALPLELEIEGDENES